MLENIWWIWVVIGIFLIIIEIFTQNFLIMWFGIASIVTAIPVYYNSPLEVVIFIYTVTLLILTTYVRKLTINHFLNDTSIKTNTDILVGQRGVVTNKINISKGIGRVKIGHEDWSALSIDNSVLEVGTKVKVKSIDGVKLIVEEE